MIKWQKAKKEDEAGAAKKQPIVDVPAEANNRAAPDDGMVPQPPNDPAAAEKAKGKSLA